MKIKDSLLTLKEMDTWSLVLFVLFKIKDLPEYSSLSELAYVLDKDAMLRLCEYFGGLTIKIPTIEELETIIYALVIYQNVNIDKVEYSKAVDMIGDLDNLNLRTIKSTYSKISKVLDDYSFSTR